MIKYVHNIYGSFELPKLELFLVLIFSLMFAGFFFLPTSSHRLVMYIGMPFMLFFLYREPVWSLIGQAGVFGRLIALFILMYAFSALWSQDVDVSRVISKFKLLIFVPVIFCTFYFLIQKSKAIWPFILSCFVISAFVTGALLFIQNMHQVLADYDYFFRLRGFGKADNSVQCALLYGLALIVLVFPPQGLSKTLKHPCTRIIGVVLFFSLMMMTGSRGPILALFVSVFSILLLCMSFRSILSIICISLSCVSFFLLLPSAELVHVRSDAGRFQIWNKVVEEIKEKPILGHGVAANNDRKIFNEQAYEWEVAKHEHNVYLSTIYHLGFIGFALFLSIIVLAGMTSFKMIKQSDDFVSVGFAMMGLVLGFVDFGGFFNNLSSTWLVFWFPLAYVLSRSKYYHSLKPLPK
ncbi:MAG: O-antigen ligase family protein [Bdellovibrionales bacterium]